MPGCPHGTWAFLFGGYPQAWSKEDQVAPGPGSSPARAGASCFVLEFPTDVGSLSTFNILVPRESNLGLSSGEVGGEKSVFVGPKSVLVG